MVTKKLYYIGVDPGMRGGMAVISAAGFLDAQPLPMRMRGKKKELDIAAFSHWVAYYASFGVRLAVVEDVHTMPGEGNVSSFRFGFGAGSLNGVLVAHGIKVARVKPEVWKSVMNVSANKKQAIAKAKNMVGAANAVKIGAHDGKAEAVLMAHFAMKSGF